MSEPTPVPVQRADPVAEHQVIGGVRLFGNLPLDPVLPGGPDLNDYMIDGGGPRLVDVHVVPIFWGTGWDDRFLPNPSINQVIGGLFSIMGGPYLDGLAQYGAGRGQVQFAFGSRSTSVDPPNNPVKDGDCETFLKAGFDSENFPNPADQIEGADPNVSQFLYVLFLPPGFPNEKSGLGGEHWWFDYNGTHTHVAWVNYGTLDFITKLFSHELNEAVSDPEGNGISFRGEACGDAGGWCEIGDVCQGYSGSLNGVQVEAYWSRQDAACIIPTVPVVQSPRWWQIAGAEVSSSPMARSGLVVGRNANGAMELFARGFDGTVSSVRQSPRADWDRAWHSLGGEVLDTTDMAVAANSDGRLELFVRRFDGAVWHAWQPTADADPGVWSGWASLGGQILGSPTAARGPEGALHVFVCGTDGAVYEIVQTETGDWGQAWHSLGGQVAHGLFVVPQIVVAANSDGRLELFVRWSDSTAWHAWQSPAGDWSDWAQIPGLSVLQMTTTVDGNGSLVLVAEGTDGSMWYVRQSASASWGGAWSSLGGRIKGHFQAGTNGDGRLEFFHIGTDDAIWHIWEVNPGGGWSPWTSMGGVGYALALGTNADGRFEVFHTGGDSDVWHCWQTAPSNGWND